MDFKNSTSGGRTFNEEKQYFKHSKHQTNSEKGKTEKLQETQEGYEKFLNEKSTQMAALGCFLTWDWPKSPGEQ